MKTNTMIIGAPIVVSQKRYAPVYGVFIAGRIFLIGIMEGPVIFALCAAVITRYEK